MKIGQTIIMIGAIAAMRLPIVGANCGTALHLSKPIAALSLTALTNQMGEARRAR